MTDVIAERINPDNATVCFLREKTVQVTIYVYIYTNVHIPHILPCVCGCEASDGNDEAEVEAEALLISEAHSKVSRLSASAALCGLKKPRFLNLRSRIVLRDKLLCDCKIKSFSFSFFF